MLGGRHLVGFQHRHSGQAELQAGNDVPRVGHDAVHRVDAFEGGGEGTFFLDRPDEQKGEAARTAKEVLRLRQ